MIALRGTSTGLLALTRPANAVIAGAGILAVGVMAGAPADAWPRLAAASAAAALIGSAGNVVNDVFDIEIDRINKPHRPLPSGRVGARTAVWWGVTCAVTGLVLSLSAGTVPFLIAAATIPVLYGYSAILKRIPLLGNITVGVVTGAAFLFGAAAAGDISAGIIPAAFACLYNIGREIVKDVEDMHGDRAGGTRTFPLVYGVEAALALATVILGIVAAASPLPWLLGQYNTAYLVLVIAVVDSLVLYSIISMWHTPTTGNLARVCLLLKIGMAGGILAFVAGVL